MKGKLVSGLVLLALLSALACLISLKGGDLFTTRRTGDEAMTSTSEDGHVDIDEEHGEAAKKLSPSLTTLSETFSSRMQLLASYLITLKDDNSMQSGTINHFDRAKNSFSVGPEDRFWINGEKVFLYSGSFHYFRLPEAYWQDRLLKLKEMGLNTLQFYIPWNLAELKGENSHLRFIELASKLGFFLILRPGPYVCGEWDYGGFPGRLAEFRDGGLRTWKGYKKGDENDDKKLPGYLREVKRYWDKLLPSVRDLLWVNGKGGRVILVQMENEYGSWGDTQHNEADAAYMRFLLNLAKKHLGTEVTYFTTDGTGILDRGRYHDEPIYSVGDFGPGDNTTFSFDYMRRVNAPGKSPDFVSEYYTGWLTAWGEPAWHATPTEPIIATMKTMSSFNFYMAYGGTNFGFTNGMNLAGPGLAGMQPQVTSYDYNSPVTEDGGHGIGTDNVDKFEAIQKEISSRTTLMEQIWKYTNTGFDKNTKRIGPAVKYTDFQLSRSSNAGLRSGFPRKDSCKYLLQFGETSRSAANNIPVILHEHKIYDHYTLTRLQKKKENHAGVSSCSVTISDVQDRLYVFVESKEIARYERYPFAHFGGNSTTHDLQLPNEVCTGAAAVDFLLESYGRTNFNPYNMPADNKGFKLKLNGNTQSGTTEKGSDVEIFVCGGLFDKILDSHHAQINWDEKQISSDSASPAEQAFIQSKKQMQYIFPGMDKQSDIGLSGTPSEVEVPNTFLKKDDSADNSRIENTATDARGPPYIWSTEFETTESDLDPATHLFRDTYLDLRSVSPAGQANEKTSEDQYVDKGKGVVFVNGLNLGRYFNSLGGPTFTIYLPGVFLKPGKNVMSVVEFERQLDSTNEFTLKSVAKAVYVMPHRNSTSESKSKAQVAAPQEIVHTEAMQGASLSSETVITS